jgi:hypothetical protein
VNKIMLLEEIQMHKFGKHRPLDIEEVGSVDQVSRVSIPCRPVTFTKRMDQVIRGISRVSIPCRPVAFTRALISRSGSQNRVS